MMDEDKLSITEEVQKRYKMAYDYYQDQWNQSLEDHEFCDIDKQWSEVDKQRRGNRPILTIDRTSKFLNQIANDQRQNRQSIDVHPVDDRSDIETAKVIKGLIKHIEYNSKADIAYDTAFMYALRGGFGFIRVHNDYCSDDSFDQEIKISPIFNPFLVYLDPASVKPDGSDAEWAILIQDMSISDYKIRFPNSDLQSFQSLEDSRKDWYQKGKFVRVAEYYKKVYESVTIYKLEDGTVTDKKPTGNLKILEKRNVAKVRIKHYIVNAAEEPLEETTFPGYYIPIVPVYGQSLLRNGRLVYQGLIRQMRDVQKLINYWKSTQAEIIALTPKAPYIGPAGFMANHEQEWARLNISNQPAIEYTPVEFNGQIMPPPTRNFAEPAVAAVTQALISTEEDLKAVTGMYDPNLGVQNGDQSGVAIRSLQHQGQVGNFHFQDNFSRTIRHIGRIIVDIIPNVYDTSRVLRIIGDDETHNVITVNNEYYDEKTGETKLYDLTVGKYDVIVSSGPSYATKRIENLNVLLDLIGKLPPQQAMVISPSLVSQMDTPAALEISDKLKKTLPPEIRDDDKKAQQIPPQLQDMLNKLQQENQMLHNELQRINIEYDKEANKLKTQKEIAELNAQVKLIEIESKINSQEATQLLKAEMEAINRRIELLNADTASPEQEPTINQPNYDAGEQLSAGQELENV